MNDQQLCEALEGTGDVLRAFPVFCVTRKGYLLLALPRDKVAARATLKLYHPQSFLARVLMKVISCLITFSLHIFLPCRVIRIREKSPLVSIQDHSQKIGFLLGNATADARRAIILHASEHGYWVDKLGLGETARLSVIDEMDVIKRLPSNHDGLPVMKAFRIEDLWASYTTPYLLGESAKKVDQPQIIDLLRSWMTMASDQTFGETRQWNEMLDYVNESKDASLMARWEAVAEASTLKVKIGLFHGDFAPWNIKMTADGAVHVMDWEHARLNGPMGWDWLHYMFQHSSLVENLPIPAVLDHCRTWTSSPEGKKFLEQAGWAGHEELCLQCYMMYSEWIMGFDRSLGCMKNFD